MTIGPQKYSPNRYHGNFYGNFLGIDSKDQKWLGELRVGSGTSEKLFFTNLYFQLPHTIMVISTVWLCGTVL